MGDPQKISDPERALANLLARDELFASLVAPEPPRLHLSVIEVATDQSMDDMTRLVARALGFDSGA